MQATSWSSPWAVSSFTLRGRHPLAGIACAFAGVSGGFSANFIPSGIDPLLQGFTQQAAQIIDPAREVNPLSNWLFTSLSCLFVVAVGWFLTDRVIEPRLRGVALDGEDEAAGQISSLSAQERKGLRAGLLAMVIGIGLLVAAAYPETSPLRSSSGELTAFSAPIMQSIVPLIFLLFIIPGTIYGYVAGTVSSHRDIIAGMTASMHTMSYYLVMIFFLRSVHLRIRAIQPRRTARCRRRRPAAETCVARRCDTGRHCRAHRFRQSAGGFSFGQMGAAGTGIRARADAGRPVAGTHPGGLSGGRFFHQHHYSVDALLPSGSGLLSALGEHYGHWYGHRADAALRNDSADRLDGVPADLLGGGYPPGAGRNLFVPLTGIRT